MNYFSLMIPSAERTKKVAEIIAKGGEAETYEKGQHDFKKKEKQAVLIGECVCMCVFGVISDPSPNV